MKLRDTPAVLQPIVAAKACGSTLTKAPRVNLTGRLVIALIVSEAFRKSSSKMRVCT